MALPDPAEPLRELGRSQLRLAATELGLGDREQLPRSASALSEVIMRGLGWALPAQVGFSPGAAVKDGRIALAKLELASDEEEICGAGAALIGRVEEVLRFSSAAWASQGGGDNWSKILEEAVGKSERLSFGDWVTAFVEVPKILTRQGQHFGRSAKLVKRAKIRGRLDELARLRNDIHHPERISDWSQVRDNMLLKAPSAFDALGRLLEQKALPIVVSPFEEIRDAYGRYRLRCVDDSGRLLEWYCGRASDLSSALVLFSIGSNPRDIDPPVMQAAVVQERAGVAR